jgi:hypothetical protein
MWDWQEDTRVLAFAASENRIVLTHDVNTMLAAANVRVAAGQPMPGVFGVRQSVRLATAIEEIVVLVECSHEGEWEGVVCFLPI